jgi:predicted RNA-binding Zn-ribbon protein involved in translation (DUF1610 family)
MKLQNRQLYEAPLCGESVRLPGRTEQLWRKYCSDCKRFFTGRKGEEVFTCPHDGALLMPLGVLRKLNFTKP